MLALAPGVVSALCPDAQLNKVVLPLPLNPMIPHFRGMFHILRKGKH
jgi:hypothetical protein